MVARAAGAAGPVLLACRQWDPLGLARWLPSLGVGAWRSAPLLPWRVQCLVRVCAALAAGSGGSGRCLVLCLPRFPLPAPRVPRCVWRAVPSGCPLSSLAGTPFHAVCAFRELGPVALLVVPACPWCVCALALSRCPLPPPPWVVWRAHLAWSRRWALVGPFHAVRAPPRVLPRSLAPSGVPRGGRPGPGSPLPGLGLCAPRGVGLRLRGVPVPGGGVWGGGGRPVCRAPRLYGRGGQWGGGSLCLVPSLCLPWAGNKAGVTGVVLVMEGVAPIPLRFVLACLLWAWSVRRPGALARVRVLPAVPAGAGGWGGGAGRAPAPLSGAAVPPGGGGTIPSAPGGWGPVLLRLAGRRGGRGGGGSRRGPSAPHLGGGPRFPTLPLLSSSAHSPRRARSVGVVGPPRAPGAACLARGGGGGRGGPWTAPPGAPSDPNPPSALPEWATLWVARCSGLGGRGPHTVPVRRRVPPPGVVRAPLRRAGAAPAPCGSRRLGALGRAVCWSSCAPPPASRSLLGEGGRPFGSGGVGGRRSCGPRAGGGGRGGGVRSAAPRPPAPLGVGLPSIPPGYTRAVGVAGRPWASGAARSAANGSVRRGGGGEGGGECRSVAGRAGA